MNPTAIAQKYISSINSQNTSGLSSLMTGGHSVTLPDGSSAKGKDTSVRKWKEFFSTYKDYRLTIKRATESNGVVSMSGMATCLIKDVSGPTNCTITLEAGKVASVTF